MKWICYMLKVTQEGNVGLEFVFLTSLSKHVNDKLTPKSSLKELSVTASCLFTELVASFHYTDFKRDLYLCGKNSRTRLRKVT